jgi:hypothetical protein
MTEPGETHVVGAVFQPGGIGAFIDGPIDAIANRILPMDELAPSIVAPGTLSAETDPAAKTPLEAFGGLTIGEWETEDSRHVLKWGVARKVVRSTSYFKVEGEWTLVSEGMWFWDAREQQIRGIAVATGMPVELFEYPLCAITGTRGIRAASR